MKCLFLLLLACLISHVKLVPLPAEPTFSGSITENAPTCRPASSDAAGELTVLLTEILEHAGDGETAGASIRASVLAARLLDWMAANAPTGEVDAADLAGFAETLTAAEKAALSARLAGLSAVALRLCAGETGGVEDGGYLPRFYPWDADAARDFFAALSAAFQNEYSEIRSEK